MGRSGKHSFFCAGAFGAAFILAACAMDGSGGARAAGAGQRGEQCFYPNRGTTFSTVDRDHVDVRIGSRRVYRLTLGAGCFDIDWAQAIALRSRTGSGFICSAGDAEIFAPSPGLGPQRCLVTDIRRLTEAEINARRRR